MPSHTPIITKLDDRITQAIYRQVDEGCIEHLDVLFTGWQSGRPVALRQSLFPINVSDLPTVASERPLLVSAFLQR